MKIAFSICILVFLTTLAAIGIKKISFTQNCDGYLERAANANTVETAKKELGIAVDYLEKNGLTSGYTSVFYKTPDEDIGFWYQNLKASLEELATLPENSTPLEKTNVLMKLRETLIHHGSEGGESVTVPSGISRYPSNTVFMALFVIFGFLSFVTGAVVFNDNY